MKKNEYYEKLKDPRWQKKRLEIFQRDDFTCQRCYSTENTLNVHHLYYIPDREPWDYPNDILITLCQECHEYEREYEYSQELIKILKVRHFLADDLELLAHSFYNLVFTKPPEVMATIISWALNNESIMKYVEEEYFKYCAEKRKK
jgi:hypothetical protein